jgi:hypothetical protein
VRGAVGPLRASRAIPLVGTRRQALEVRVSSLTRRSWPITSPILPRLIISSVASCSSKGVYAPLNGFIS